MCKPDIISRFDLGMERSKIYFASDFHLGLAKEKDGFLRERMIISWLDEIKADAKALYLVGDIFDFWFEYKTVVPRGFIRFLGKLAELSDVGIELIFFKGNHDMWMFDYFQKELNAKIIDNEFELYDQGKCFFIHHGDGLGSGDRQYKILKKIFRSRLCQWLFARLHPNLGIGIAQKWSAHSRAANADPEEFQGYEKEWLIGHSEQMFAEGKKYDFYIYGHRHLPYFIELKNGSKVLNLGEWFHSFTYAVWDGHTLELKKYIEKGENKSIPPVRSI